MSFLENIQALVNWGYDHERLFKLLAFTSTIVSVTVTIGFGTFVGWWLRHRKAKEDQKRYENMESGDKQIVFEAHILTDQPDGSILLEIEAWGRKHSLSHVFCDDILEDKIKDEAAKRDGMLYLDPPGQRMMMSSLCDTIVGNDWKANPAAIMNRTVNKDWLVFTPVSWRGQRDAHFVRVIILNREWMARLADPKEIAKIRPFDPHYEYRRDWLAKIGQEWLVEKTKDRAVARIWETPIRSAISVAQQETKSSSELLTTKAA